MADKRKRTTKKKPKKTTKKKQTHIDKKMGIIIGILIVLSIILVGITFSYAFWTYSDTQVDVNEVTAGCLSFSFNDKDVNGNVTSINLSNTYPMSDARGLSLNPYVFTVTNTCTIDNNVFVYLHEISSSSMDSQYIKISLNDNNNFNYMSPTIVNNINNGVLSNDVSTIVESKVGDVNKTYLLSNFTLKQNESITLNLRMWIDYDAPNSIMGLSYNSAVSVFATTPE